MVIMEGLARGTRRKRGFWLYKRILVHVNDLYKKWDAFFRFLSEKRHGMSQVIWRGGWILSLALGAYAHCETYIYILRHAFSNLTLWSYPQALQTYRLLRRGAYSMSSQGPNRLAASVSPRRASCRLS